MQKNLQQIGGSYVVFQNYGGHVIFIVNLSLKGQSQLKSYILKKNPLSVLLTIPQTTKP